MLILTGILEVHPDIPGPDLNPGLQTRLDDIKGSDVERDLTAALLDRDTVLVPGDLLSHQPPREGVDLPPFVIIQGIIEIISLVIHLATKCNNYLLICLYFL